jgi:two-component system OmpR family response regulator
VGAVRKSEKEAPRIVMVVSRQANRRRELLSVLALSGWRSREAPSLNFLLSPHRSGRIDLVVLDWKREDHQEFARVRVLHARSRRPPIMIVCQGGTPHDAATAFGAGASDFVADPFNGWEFLARCDSLVDSRDETVVSIRLGPVSIDRANQTVECEGAPINLTRTEFQILTYLAHRQGTVVSDEEIVTVTLGEAYVSGSAVVRFHICHLRTKLRGTGVRIETVRGAGHRVACKSTNTGHR